MSPQHLNPGVKQRSENVLKRPTVLHSLLTSNCSDNLYLNERQALCILRNSYPLENPCWVFWIGKPFPRRKQTFGVISEATPVPFRKTLKYITLVWCFPNLSRHQSQWPGGLIKFRLWALAPGLWFSRFGMESWFFIFNKFLDDPYTAGLEIVLWMDWKWLLALLE